MAHEALMKHAYEALTKLLAGKPDEFLDMWDRDSNPSLMLSLGERDFGWEAVREMLVQVSTIVGSSPVHATIKGKLQHWAEEGNLAYAVTLDTVEASGTNPAPSGTTTQRSTWIWRRVGDTWKIVHYHTDTVSPQQETLSYILRHPHIAERARERALEHATE